MAKNIDIGLLRLQEQAKIFGVCRKHALGVVRLGAELGMLPMMSLLKVKFIHNQATLSPLTMLSIINASEKLEDISITDDGSVCWVMMKRIGRTSRTETFSMEDAKRLGLLKFDHWEKYPKNMRKLRAVSMCSRIVFPDLVGGFVTPEEAGADVDENGEMILVNPIKKFARRFKRSTVKVICVMYRQIASVGRVLKTVTLVRKRKYRASNTERIIPFRHAR